MFTYVVCTLILQYDIREPPRLTQLYCDPVPYRLLPLGYLRELSMEGFRYHIED